MKAKKIVLLVLAAAALCVCTACGCSKKDSAPSASAAVGAAPSPAAPAASASAAPTAAGTAAASAPTPVPPSSNKEVVTDEKAPKEIYWLVTDPGNNLTYHLKDCPQISGKDAQKIGWDVVKSIGLRQCPECNPPQYEGYVDAE